MGTIRRSLAGALALALGACGTGDGARARPATPRDLPADAAIDAAATDADAAAAAPDRGADTAAARDAPLPDRGAADAPPPPPGAVCGPLQLLPDGTFFPIKPAPDRPLRLGASAGGSSPMNGDFDQVRFYRRALDVDEIARHAARTYEPCTIAAGCVAEYTFDAIDGGSFPDSGEKGLRAVIMKQPMALVDGVLGRAARFDGTGWLEVAPAPELEFTHAMTYETWIRTRGVCPPTAPDYPTCNFYNLFDRYGEGGTSTVAQPRSGLRLDFHVKGCCLRFAMTTGVFHWDNLAEPEHWIHVAATFDDKRGVRFYKNGKLAKSCVIP